MPIPNVPTSRRMCARRRRRNAPAGRCIAEKAALKLEERIASSRTSTATRPGGLAAARARQALGMAPKRSSRRAAMASSTRSRPSACAVAGRGPSPPALTLVVHEPKQSDGRRTTRGPRRRNAEPWHLQGSRDHAPRPHLLVPKALIAGFAMGGALPASSTSVANSRRAQSACRTACDQAYEANSHDKNNVHFFPFRINREPWRRRYILRRRDERCWKPECKKSSRA